MSGNINKPDIIKSLKWGAFSVTATFCAFVLPVFIFTLLSTPVVFNPPLPDWIFIIVFLGVLFCAFYHSIYRIYASDHDLQLKSKFLFWIGSIIAGISVIEILHFILLKIGVL
ncbi:hypothetical protein KJ951_02095 [Patescibacteria group bacterium]|nr:hypothetical protein [Patescibacteria group bacterium]MBU1703171.1 hypothetical protein [Patescibacteria group bacterium]MBU1954312.1 hypothetical protein [Patescibacteria group bacterium]